MTGCDMDVVFIEAAAAKSPSNSRVARPTMAGWDESGTLGCYYGIARNQASRFCVSLLQPTPEDDP
jgi:hypothetical protein